MDIIRPTHAEVGASGPLQDVLRTDYVWDRGAGLLSKYDYDVDGVGNRTELAENDMNTTTYECDMLYRLKDVTYPNADIESYTHDRAGNRLSTPQTAAMLAMLQEPLATSCFGDLGT